jgi:hypothetical protein
MHQASDLRCSGTVHHTYVCGAVQVCITHQVALVEMAPRTQDKIHCEVGMFGQKTQCNAGAHATRSDTADAHWHLKVSMGSFPGTTTSRIPCNHAQSRSGCDGTNSNKSEGKCMVLGQRHRNAQCRYLYSKSCVGCSACNLTTPTDCDHKTFCQVTY